MTAVLSDSPKKQTINKSLSSLVCGGLAGLTAKTIVAPLDRIKIIFQVTNEKYSFRNLPKVFNTICKEEGFLALWKGNSATILRIAPYAGIQFMTYDYLKRWFDRTHAASAPHSIDGPVPRTMWVKATELMLCGGIAGAVSSTATYPLDLARSRLAVESHTCPELKRKSNPRLTLRVFRLLGNWATTGGVRELYRGLSPTLIGIIPYGAISFSTNEITKQWVKEWAGRECTTVQKLVCGAVAGIVAQTVVYPLEMIRRRMQTTGHVNRSSYLSEMSRHSTPASTSSSMKTAAASAPPEHSMVTVINQLYRTEGWRAFYKGLSLNWIKGPIAVSISFTTFDFIKNKVERWEQKE
mmetsp:Transcript_20179/g.28978  ORF Transcript_20179/g.28978 Transcript_20179/m.28978 type:complete len:353 (-) Transcript_20179:176-1234(-)|eukprot:CAMPEP_0185034882 /NCGR_PEP_ID=MMETSP1103-20130426/25231_1 /TAXON_ID=36769 /ORGANISM="Paraphysomonas bandaiensis, Strain Caron Lab Isolate" /LENGTH=352 /DNA_ID=CAMNT_0027571711 /DNA_START=21 /DNA_END=1079 /DNA_ORIENTATION=+